MKVVVIGSYAPSLLNFRGPMLKALADAGHNVTAVAPGADQEVVDSLSRLNVRFCNVPMQRTGQNPITDFNTYRNLQGLIREIAPDVVFSYTIKPIVYGIRAAYQANVRERVAMVTGLGYAFEQEATGFGFKRWVAQNLYRNAMDYSSKVVFQNPDDRDLFVKLGILRDPEKASLVNGSGVDLAHFAFSPVPAGATTFLLLARLLKEKGIREYAVAAGRLKTKYPEASFRLAGAFDEHPNALTKQEVDRWSELSAPQYLGALSDVRPLLNACTVYVLPSYREGTPRSVLEAMAVGRAVITTNEPGCRQTVIPGENGFLVPARDSDALESAMEKFILDPSLAAKMGVRSREIAIERFDVNKVNKALFHVMGLSQQG